MKFKAATEILTQIMRYNMEEFEASLKTGTSRASDFVIPFLVGDPGVGKTAIPKLVSKELELPYAQAIVAQYDAGEMAGIPYIAKELIAETDAKGNPIYDVLTDKDGNAVMEGDEPIRQARMREQDKLVRARPDYLPTFAFGIFNLDELPQAFLANQNICSQLVNEYRVGHHEISHGVTIVCTGNKPENKAGTTTIPTHLRDRLMYIPIEADYEEFLEYAAIKGIDPRVRSYIRQNPGKLHTFDPTANANPSPRSWEKASTILKLIEGGKAKLSAGDKANRRVLLEGQIGATATHFETWLRVEDELPDPDMVIANPKTAPVFDATKAAVLHLLLSSLADKCTAKNIGNVIEYVMRCPNAEFQAWWAQDAFRRDRSLMKTPEGKKWLLGPGVKLRI